MSLNRLGFVFPGQGSQSVGMLNGYLADSESAAVVLSVLAEASEALGEDLEKLIAHGPAERLAMTVNTQPVMLVAGVACWRVWQSLGGAVPAYMAGHSLGEYAALTASGALALGDAVKLVRFRAQAMQEAVPVGVGAMAAILGLDADNVRAACDESAQGEVVEAVNFNDPAQTVIAGHASAVARACEAAKGRGAKRAVMLPVSAPFHSSLLQPAAERLREYLEGVVVSSPEIPVLNNVDVAAPSDPALIRDALSRQAAAPVRWVELVRAMSANGVTTIAECGPGKVLAGLVKRIDPTVTGVALTDLTAMNQLREQTQ